MVFVSLKTPQMPRTDRDTLSPDSPSPTPGKWSTKDKRVHFRGSHVISTVMTSAGLNLSPPGNFANGPGDTPGRMTLLTPRPCSLRLLDLDTCTLPGHSSPLRGQQITPLASSFWSCSRGECPTQDQERLGPFPIHSSGLISSLKLTGGNRPGRTVPGVASGIYAVGPSGRNADQPGDGEWVRKPCRGRRLWT